MLKSTQDQSIVQQSIYITIPVYENNLDFFHNPLRLDASVPNQSRCLYGRGGEIRTHDLRYPKPSRSQAAPFVDDFTKRIVERVKAFKLGDPLNPTTDIGSMITKDFKEMG